MFSEYTYQIINGCPSENWLAHVNDRKVYQPLYEIEPKEFSIKSESFKSVVSVKYVKSVKSVNPVKSVN